MARARSVTAGEPGFHATRQWPEAFNGYAVRRWPKELEMDAKTKDLVDRR